MRAPWILALALACLAVFAAAVTIAGRDEPDPETGAGRHRTPRRGTTHLTLGLLALSGTGQLLCAAWLVHWIAAL